MKITDILSEQSVEPVFASPHQSVAQVAAVMAEKRIGVVMIRDENGALVGIVSERDIVRAAAERDPSFIQGPAVDIGTRGVVTCRPNSEPDYIYKDMIDRKIRHMPVLEDEKVIGMVSMTDLLRFFRAHNSPGAAARILEALSHGAIRSSL